ncbi:ankyrin repeat-containing domain protein [Aspergillus coremiiformis]|uniref:Ankyrin repeat-containing domain protein n=1 Tax=Aspergillus coremiiformis TaxID=138285 RepID=A0A5N6ZCR1_9EURO|nr:ankyrin repeat-containing domain protein [Aspergillus coremiiformis]
MYPIEQRQQQAEDAARSGNAAELRDCLAHGAILNVVIYLLALDHGDVATFQTILDFGGDANYDMHYSGTPLILALKFNHQALFHYLLSLNVNPNQGSLGHWLPPLSVAVRLTKDIQWVQHLLEIGARIEGTGALHIAAFQGNLPRMRLLLHHGADVNEIPFLRIYAMLNFYTTKGTPVHWAIAGGHLDAVQLLLQRDTDLAIRDEDGVTVQERLDDFFSQPTTGANHTDT